MNYSSFFKILLVITIIITACICSVKPQMHSSVVVTDSSYMVTEQDYKPEEVKKNDVIATVSREELQKPKTVAKKVVEPVTNTVQKKQVSEKKNNIAKKVEAPKKVMQAPKQEKVVTKTQTKPATTTMTAKQEEIAWNVWRSNLQNQIMKDSKLPDIPTGVVFKFKFTVDKYGKVSSVKTWSLNPSYTPIAIQYIAPVIRSYQGHSILDFPSGTNRVITDVEGGFKVSTSSRYSSPTDYNDVETVKR